MFSRAEIDEDNAQDVITFNYVQSQQIPGAAGNGNATLMDTNMPTASQLPLRHQMVIFSVQIRFDEMNTAPAGMTLDQAENAAGVTSPALGINKWNIFTSNVYFQLMVENVKPYTEGPMTQYPHGGGIYFNQNAGALVTASETEMAYQAQNGWPGTDACRRLAMPVHLGALEQFQGIIRFPRGALTGALEDANIDDGLCGQFGVNIGLFGPRQRPLG